MAVGFPTDAQTINAVAAQTILNLREGFAQIVRLKQYLDGETDQELVDNSDGLWDMNDVAVLNSAITDLYNLHRVALGQQTQENPSDFFYFAREITGIQ